MDRFKFNYATVIALAVLLFYAYIAAMGSLFRDKILGIPSQGRIWVAVVVFLLVVALVFLCIVMMCVAKATRWKNIGTSGQIGFGIIILVVLILAGGPFSTFLKAAKEQNKNSFTTLVTNIKEDAKGLDKAYNEHVDNRVKAYERQLKDDTTFTVTEVNNRINSLRNHLYPETTEDVQSKRQDWIEGIKEMSVWNILMRSNLDSLQYTVQNWMADYQRRDSVRFAGEDYPYFTYEKFENRVDENGEELPSIALNGLLSELGKNHFSGFSVFIALLCWLFMLLPWIITRKPR